jgi:hypothetical protein
MNVLIAGGVGSVLDPPAEATLVHAVNRISSSVTDAVVAIRANRPLMDDVMFLIAESV